MSNIYILVESDHGQLKSYSLELATKGCELAAKLGGTLEAVAINETPTNAALLGEYGVAKLTVLTNSQVGSYSTEGFVTMLASFLQANGASVVLGTASAMGKDILPRVAARLKAGMASDCLDISVEGTSVVATRPVFAGKALTKIGFNSAISVMALRPNVVMAAKADSPVTTTVSAQETAAGTPKAIVVSTKVEEKGEVDLTEAAIIVSGGRAVGSADGFGVVRDLAKALGASVGASRAAVDAGYISHEHQVGQTGKTVNPTLYIACGISGAIQHLAGMRTSKVIVAINKDKEAPIFKRADFGLVGDMFTILPLLTEKVKAVIGH